MQVLFGCELVTECCVHGVAEGVVAKSVLLRKRKLIWWKKSSHARMGGSLTVDGELHRDSRKHFDSLLICYLYCFNRKELSVELEILLISRKILWHQVGNHHKSTCFIMSLWHRHEDNGGHVHKDHGNNECLTQRSTAGRTHLSAQPLPESSYSHSVFCLQRILDIRTVHIWRPQL